jgi:hypothetical protein
MTQPVVSICIPTFNRCRYLESLLGTLVQQLDAFPHAYEIVIADNASSDDTPQVVQRFQSQLPIRHLRHAQNIGGFANWQYVFAQAAGQFIVYLADDDCLIGEQVALTIDRMLADPDVVVVYAPWILFDLVRQRSLGQFYEVPHDLRIERGRHGELLDHVLRHHIFPEVQITRRDALQRLMPRINEHAFFAFVHAADYLSMGTVLIQKTPFYAAITDYFADEVREQLGNDEVEVAWDRYRGGLEYLLARARVSAEERVGLNARIQQMIAVRMSVAIRLRHLRRRNPVDTYMLAMRLRGMGYEALCPVPLATLANQAALHFLIHDDELNRGIQRLLCIGSIEPAVRSYLQGTSRHPVDFAPAAPPAAQLADTLLLLCDGSDDALPDEAALAQRNCRVVREDALFDKYAIA